MKHYLDKKTKRIVQAIVWDGTTLPEIIKMIGLHPSVAHLKWEAYVALVNKEGFVVFNGEESCTVSLGDYVTFDDVLGANCWHPISFLNTFELIPIKEKIKVSKKKEPIVDAFVYFKNQKVVSARGTVEEDEESIVFRSGDFLSTITKSEMSCIVIDCAPELLDIYKDQPVSGFEIYMDSGTSQGFNGWEIEPNHYLSKQGDYLEIYEPVCYLKQGPEDPKKNEAVKKDKKEKKVVSKKDNAGSKD